jgi:hypothetical protein
VRKRRLPGCVPAQGVGDPPNRRTVGSAPIVDVVLLRCRAPMEARLTDTTERLFIAAELPPSVVEEIAARQAGLRQLVSALRFEPATLMHLTLCFVGATVASRIPLFISALLSALARKSVRSKLTSQRFARSPRSLLCALFVSASRAPKTLSHFLPPASMLLLHHWVRSIPPVDSRRTSRLLACVVMPHRLTKSGFALSSATPRVRRHIIGRSRP